VISNIRENEAEKKYIGRTDVVEEHAKLVN
jgi:hypothetical protein